MITFKSVVDEVLEAKFPTVNKGRSEDIDTLTFVNDVGYKHIVRFKDDRSVSVEILYPTGFATLRTTGSLINLSSKKVLDLYVGGSGLLAWKLIK